MLNFVYVCVSVPMTGGVWGRQKRVSNSPPVLSMLQLQTVVNCLFWVLGIDSGFSGKTAHSFSYSWASSPAPHHLSCIFLFCFAIVCFVKQGLICRPGWFWIHREISASASQVLVSKAPMLFSLILFLVAFSHFSFSVVHCQYTVG